MNLKQHLMTKYVNNDVAAKYLLRNGMVKVNGHIIENGELPADDRDSIEINSDYLKENREFWEFRELDEEYGLISKDDTVIFIGSTTEGIPKYCQSKQADVFIVGLTGPEGFKLVEENPLKTSFDRIFEQIRMKGDLLVVDMDMGPIRSFEILQNNINLSKQDGYVMIFLEDDSEEIAIKFLEDLGMKFLNTIKMKNRIIIFAKNSQ